MAGLRALFLDRDGVLVKDRPDYVKTPDELQILPGIIQPLREIKHRGFLLVVITNQSAIGRGLTTEDQVAKTNDRLRLEMGDRGCNLDAIYYCPHRPDQECNCRKPAPGLILKAASDLGIDTSQSWMIGDKESDVEAARRAGCRAVKVRTNDGGLGEAVRVILSSEDTKKRFQE